MEWSRRGALAALIAWLRSSLLPRRADDYPTKPITFVVPYTPGGSTEILARMIGKSLRSGSANR